LKQGMEGFFREIQTPPKFRLPHVGLQVHNLAAMLARQIRYTELAKVEPGSTLPQLAHTTMFTWSCVRAYLLWTGGAG